MLRCLLLPALAAFLGCSGASGGGAPANQPPAISLSAPATGVAGTGILLTASASDADGTVARVEFFEGANLLATDLSAPHAHTWTPANPGAFTLSARATDNLGATATSAAVGILVTGTGDATPPTCALTSPLPFAAGLAGMIQIQAVATDNVGVAGVRFQMDGEDAGAEVLSPPYTATFNAALLPSGQHVLRARARDGAGNLSPWSTVVVSVSGGAVPAGFTRTSPWVTGLASATAMAFAPDGRLFVCEQGGAVRVVENGVLLPAPFATVATSANGERGLLGLAFHPAFPATPHVFVYYTALSPAPHNRISRFTAAGNVAAGGETVLVDLPDLSSATNHNGGALHVGPDGLLYAAVGENAQPSLAQSLASPFGKLLRFNLDGSIPATNPFFGATTGLNRAIWALGLRNPFTFGFQPGTGRLHINDVGQSTWEEVNLGQAGANYGWPTTEGPTANPAFTAPLFAYGHPSAPTGQPQSTGTFQAGVSVVGAAFYDPPSPAFPAAMVGNYFFADYTGNWIARMDLANGNAVYAFALTTHNLVDLATGPDGALYALGRSQITRISRP